MAGRLSRPPRVRVVLPLRAIVGLVALATAVELVVRLLAPLSRVVFLLTVALTLSCLLRPLVNGLARRTRRGIALAVVVVGVLAAAVGLAVGGGIDVARQADRVAEAVTGRLEGLDPESAVGRFVDRADLAARADRQVRAGPARLLLGVENASGGAALFGQGVLVLVLTLFALTGAPQLARGLVARFEPPARRDRLEASLRTALDAATGFVVRTIALAVLNGLVVFASAAVLGLPARVVLSVWAGACTILPLFGPVVGLAPAVVVAAAQRPSAGWAMLVVAVLAVAVVAALRSRWVSVPLRVGPLVATIGLAAGLQVGGPVGALVGLFVAALVAGGGRECCRAGGLDQPAELVDDFAQDHPPDDWVPPRQGNWVGDRVAVTLAWQSGLVLAAAFVAVAAGSLFLDKIAAVSIWAILGVALALAFNPLVGALARVSRLPRPATVVVIGLAAAAVVVVISLVAGPSLLDALADLRTQLPDTASRLERAPWLGHLLAGRDLAGGARRLLDDLPDRLAGDHSPLGGWLASAGDLLLGGFWVAMVAIAGLLDGHRVLDGVYRALPVRLRAGAATAADLGYQSFGRYAAGSALVAGANGTMVTITALTLGVPLAPLLGLWAALWNVVPQVGGLLGGAPLVALGFTVGPVQGVAALVVFLIYQNLENHVIQPLVIGRATRLSPLVTLICVLSGGAAAGFVGALLATPIAGAVKLIVGHFRQEPDPDDEPDGLRTG